MRFANGPHWGALIAPGLRVAVFLLAIELLPVTALAHRLDEYLQAALITIEPNEIKLELNLTPGEEVCSNILDQIDTNHDGTFSPTETDLYSRRVLEDLTLRLDDRLLSPALVGARCSPLEELRSGVGTFHVELRVEVNHLAPGRHSLAFRNEHLPKLSVYLVNAVVPQSNSIEVTAQVRNNIQSESHIEFNYRPMAPAVVASPARAVSWLWLLPVAVGVIGLLLIGLRLRSSAIQPSSDGREAASHKTSL